MLENLAGVRAHQQFVASAVPNRQVTQLNSSKEHLILSAT